jgi:hypothetical protein
MTVFFSALASLISHQMAAEASAVQQRKNVTHHQWRGCFGATAVLAVELDSLTERYDNTNVRRRTSPH